MQEQRGTVAGEASVRWLRKNSKRAGSGQRACLQAQQRAEAAGEPGGEAGALAAH